MNTYKWCYTQIETNLICFGTKSLSYTMHSAFLKDTCSDIKSQLISLILCMVIRAEVSTSGQLGGGWHRGRLYLGMGSCNISALTLTDTHTPTTITCHQHHRPIFPDRGVILHSRDLPGWKVRSRLAFSPTPQTARGEKRFTDSSALDQVIPNFGLNGLKWEEKVRFIVMSVLMPNYIMRIR